MDRATRQSAQEPNATRAPGTIRLLFCFVLRKPRPTPHDQQLLCGEGAWWGMRVAGRWLT